MIWFSEKCWAFNTATDYSKSHKSPSPLQKRNQAAYFGTQLPLCALEDTGLHTLLQPKWEHSITLGGGNPKNLKNNPSAGPQLFGLTSRPQPEQKSEMPSHQLTEAQLHNQVICKGNLLFIFLLHCNSNVFDLVYSLSKHKPTAGLMIYACKLIRSPTSLFAFYLLFPTSTSLKFQAFKLFHPFQHSNSKKHTNISLRGSGRGSELLHCFQQRSGEPKGYWGS